MRSHRNIDRSENEELSDRFSFLLKCNEDCTKSDFSWAAITIFDHWLYESNSFSRIEEATESEKAGWTKKIKVFLHNLVQIEEPLKYRYRGLHNKQRLQFSRYLGGNDYGHYIAGLFDKTYSPNIVFPKLGVDLWFEDNWTLHFKYKSQLECKALLKLAAENGLYVLPAYCAEHLNCYSELSAFMVENGLNKAIYRTSTA
jgi:hypothetical protein